MRQYTTIITEDGYVHIYGRLESRTHLEELIGLLESYRDLFPAPEPECAAPPQETGK